MFKFKDEVLELSLRVYEVNSESGKSETFGCCLLFSSEGHLAWCILELIFDLTAMSLYYSLILLIKLEMAAWHCGGGR